MRAALAIATLLALALTPGRASAQADNTNSLTDPDRARPAVSAPETARSPTRAVRDEPRRRERMHVLAEGLTAAELGLLYGSEFATGEADWPAAPAP
jgi:hypothetical protein